MRAQTGLLTIYVHNYGRLTHDLVITLDGRTAAATKPIAPGQTEQLDAALGPGHYLDGLLDPVRPGARRIRHADRAPGHLQDA